MRKGYISTFDAILLMLRLFCAFRKNLWVLLEKIAFQGDLGESVEVRESPEHQEEQSGRERGKARACIRAHGRAPKSHPARSSRATFLAGCAVWLLGARPCLASFSSASLFLVLGLPQTSTLSTENHPEMLSFRTKPEGSL